MPRDPIAIEMMNAKGYYGTTPVGLTEHSCESPRVRFATLGYGV
jgi:hypothetical protein